MFAGIVLAAGTSSRLGRPKQLLAYHGRPLTQHVIDAAIAASLDDVIVVLGERAEDMLAELTLPPPARARVNPDYLEGQSSSLRAGLRAAGPEIRAAVLLLGDQPTVGVGAIRAVLAEYERRGGPVVRATYGGVPGHPVLIDRSVWSEVEAIAGDVGARELLANHPEWVTEVELAAGRPADVDTWDDYQRLIGPGGGESEGARRKGK